ncbi:MAG: DUF6973 domain-containing protein [Brevinema sp.]
MSATAFAAESTPKAATLTDEVLQSMTPDDFNDCYNYLLEYKQSNPNCTNEELDSIASDFYIAAYNEHGRTPTTRSWYDDLLMSAGNMNPDELALSKKYPSDLAAVYSSSQIANNEAESRYNQGAYLGNQDAFRHAAWNALLICRFYALQKGDFNWCLTRTREWTTAHETGAPYDGNLTSTQRQADYDMDILNNAAGRAAAETTYTSEYLALKEVQKYVDNGWCKRIKTDSQMTYDYSTMLNYTWTLRPTNTVGKR